MSTVTFIAPSSAFAKALGSIVSVVSNKPLVPAAEMVLLIGSGSVVGQAATLRLVTTNFETTLSTVIQGEFAENFTALLPARHLLDTLRGLADQPVTFRLDPATFGFEIKAAKSRYKLTGMSPDEFPKAPSVAKGKQTLTLPGNVLHDGLRAALNTVLHSTGMQPAFESVLVEVSADSVRFVGADGPRVSVFEKPLTADGDEVITGTVGQFMIPRQSAQYLASLLDPKDAAPVTLVADGQNVRLVDARWVSRLTEGNYPDYRRVFPPESQNFLNVDAPELLAAVRRLDKYAPTLDHTITMSLTPGAEITLTTQSQDLSHEGREAVAGEYTGEPMQISFSAPNLASLLAQWPAGEVEVGLGLPNRVAVLRQCDVQGCEDYATLTCLLNPLQVLVAA